MIKDSGKRREFGTGAVRDIAEGKGRCDLLPLNAVGLVTDDPVLADIGSYVHTGDIIYLKDVICFFSCQHFGDIYTAILEVAKHYEEGCKKYGERNWEKGIPLHCYIDSGVRHYLKFRRGDDDERHDRAFIWNLLGALWTQERHPKLIDLPFAEQEKSDGDEVASVQKSAEGEVI